MALSPVRVLSLCSGGGGLDLGVASALARLGRAHRAVVYVEREAYACTVLAARMEEEGTLAPAPIWSDLATLDARPLRGAVDLVVAGVPCQGNSVAGKRLGRDDERWLWPHVERILAECRPEWFFLENVRGLLSVDHGAAFGDILESLAGLGFDAEWCVLGARDVGAPHRRDRVFLLAHAKGEYERESRYQRLRAHGRESIIGSGGDAADAQGLGIDVRARPEWRRLRLATEEGARVADAERDQLWHESGRRGGPLGQGAPISRDDGPRWPPGPDDDDGWLAYLAEYPDRAPAIESPLRGSAHGLAERMGSTRADELRLLGNGVVPAQAERAFIELYGRFENNS